MYFVNETYFYIQLDWLFSDCKCDTDGSIGTGCNDAGQCNCKEEFEGLKCAWLKDGFYDRSSPKGILH